MMGNVPMQMGNAGMQMSNMNNMAMSGQNQAMANIQLQNQMQQAQMGMIFLLYIHKNIDNVIYFINLIISNFIKIKILYYF